MARRFFVKKSDKVKAKALEQLRKTRAQFDKDHPDMLDQLRNKIEAAGGPEKLQFKAPAPAPAAEIKGTPPPPLPVEPKRETIEKAKEMAQDGERAVPIDREKNLGTILKYLEITDSPGIRTKLKEIILKSLH